MCTEGFYFGNGVVPRRHKGVEIGEYFGDSRTGDELHVVEPVRTNIGNGTEFTGFGCNETPVPIGIEEQPIL
jgi:hypothetical protein